ncbi:MAG: hypothetical protein OEM28_06520 [Nitrosopumilus sp.]|nr:hypothetical protein [Nitrosopumilus sp.]MDH3487217.1 hypothetical protein [Nitrosopumilus sp.]
MDQNDAIYGVEYSNYRPDDIRVIESGTYVMMTVEKTGEGLEVKVIKTSGIPLIPSIIFSIHKIKDFKEGQWNSTERGTNKQLVDAT